jgi:hypothetical protein
MANMNGWDVALLVAAGYVAVTALVRLMLRRRNEMVDQFRQRMKTSFSSDGIGRRSPARHDPWASGFTSRRSAAR